MLITGTLCTKHIRHHHDRCDRHGVAERIVQHRAQMLLELTGPGAVHRPVAGVVRAHRQLVDHQRAGGGLEQFDGQHADHPEFDGQPQRQLLCRAAVRRPDRARAR